MRNYLSTIGCALFLGSSLAQSPATDHAWLSTDNISVRITPTGIHADSTGGFILNGAQPVNLLSHLVPWIGGIDPAGNLMLAAEVDNPEHSDWKPGFRGVPNSNKVWKVTSAQIEAHLADFLDNGVVDNPIPEIFAWPAAGNAYSMDYNGFDVPTDPSNGWNPIAAVHDDKNGNGIYEPNQGEIPVFAYPGTYRLSADQLAYAPIYNDTTGALSNGRSIHTDGRLQAVTFECNGQEFLENTVFLEYRFVYLGLERLDSSFFGLYADFDIGDKGDDYLGTSLPNAWRAFAYNADTLYDAQAGANPPMLSLNVFHTPIDTNGIMQGIDKVMPILVGSPNLAQILPIHVIEYYNYLSGSWRDGTPLTFGGDGYGGITQADYPYNGHPANPNSWSELSAGNELGDRKALISFKPGSLMPDYRYEILFSLSASTDVGITAQLDQIKSFKALQDYLIHWVSFDSSFQMLCDPMVETNDLKFKPSVFISPNPASTYLSLQIEGFAIQEVMLFDMLGNLVLSKHYSNALSQDILLETSSLSPGLYLVHWLLEGGAHGVSKVVVAH